MTAGADRGAHPRIGRRGFLQGAAASAAAATALSVADSGSVAAAPAYSWFLPLSPDRLADTRPDFFVGGWSRVAPNVIRVPVAGRRLANGTVVPADATAVVCTIIGINLDARGNFLAAYPAGSTWNNTSNLNMEGLGDTVPNLVTVGLRNGGLDILTNLPAHVVVDIAGVYVPSAVGYETTRPVPRRRTAAGARYSIDPRQARVR